MKAETDRLHVQMKPTWTGYMWRETNDSEQHVDDGGWWRPTDWSKRDGLNLLRWDDLAMGGGHAGNMIDAKPAKPWEP